jgi:LytS/YehU family sensor histidine kinase
MPFPQRALRTPRFILLQLASCAHAHRLASKRRYPTILFLHVHTFFFIRLIRAIRGQNELPQNKEHSFTLIFINQDQVSSLALISVDKCSHLF